MRKLEDVRLVYVARVSGKSVPSTSRLQIIEGRASVLGLLKALTELEGLRRLELRGLGGFVGREGLKRVRRQWAQMEWIQHS